jgi:hypothetical protein
MYGLKTRIGSYRTSLALSLDKRWVAATPRYSYASHVVRSWVKLVSNSMGIAAVAVAAQLGVAEAFGIVRWTDHYEASGGNSWSALLTWIGFFYAVAVLGGSLVGRRAMRRRGRTERVLARIMSALAAAVGASAAISLALVEARGVIAPLNVNVHPELVISLVAAAGVLIGLGAAILALLVPTVAGGARASVLWLWAAAIGCALPAVITHKRAPSPLLGVVALPTVSGMDWLPGPYSMVAITAILGLGVALVARWGGAHRIGVALSGLAGPAIVAGAYAIAGSSDENHTAFLASIYAVAAGVVVGTIVALPPRDDTREEVGPDDQSWGEGDRYRPGNYLAEARAGEIVSPFRLPSQQADGTPRTEGASWSAPGWAEARPDANRSDAARTDATGSWPSVGAHVPGPTSAAAGSVPTATSATAEPARGTAPARSGAHRAEAEYPGGRGYLGREYDYPTDEYPTAPPSDATTPLMGQPPPADDGRSDWFRNLGAPAQRGN